MRQTKERKPTKPVVKKVEKVAKLPERLLAGKVEVLLSDKILSQITHLHSKVGAIEWSGVLAYEILEGSIEDHAKMKIQVQEILPMDVGTSGYTEYELNADSDDYTFDNLSRVMMDPKLKIGHIHTHHNMRCYFSNTDTTELHETAPKHNYYLSLIVNFEDPSAWCAKIVYVGEETQDGTVTSSFTGSEGEIVSREVKVLKTTKVLYVIDIDLKVDSLADDFVARVVELTKPKPASRPRNYTPDVWQDGIGQRNQHASSGRQVAGGWQKRRESEWQGKLFDDRTGDPVSYEEMLAGKSDDDTPLDHLITPVKIIEFTNRLISLTDQPTSLLVGSLQTIEAAFYADPSADKETEKEIYLEYVCKFFMDNFEGSFNVKPSVGAVNTVLLLIEEHALNESLGEGLDMPDEILGALWTM